RPDQRLNFTQSRPVRVVFPRETSLIPQLPRPPVFFVFFVPPVPTAPPFLKSKKHCALILTITPTAKATAHGATPNTPQQLNPRLAHPDLNPHQAWRTGMPSQHANATTAILQTELACGRHQRSVYELFAEMEDKDRHLYSVIQTRI